MVFWGYFIAITYILALLVFTQFLRKKTSDVELGRKIVHIGTFLLLPVAWRFFVYKEHLVILCTIFTLLTLLSNKFKLFKGIERNDPKQFGTVYYALSLLLFSIVCVIERVFRGSDAISFACLAAAFTALSLGDGAASLLGSRIPSKTLHKSKTLLGTLSCCTFTCLGLFLIRLLHLAPLTVTAIFAIGLLAGIGELFGGKWDNLTVPLSCYLACLASLTLGQAFDVALLLFASVFYLGFLCKFLTLAGAISAGFIGGFFLYIGGILPLLFLLFSYGVMLVCSLVQKLKKSDVSSMVAKTKGKDFTEIFVNGFFACLAMLLFGIFKQNVFLLISLTVLSANFVDSLSSDIGVLSKTPPYDLFKRKKVEKGESGGMTPLGTFAAACGAIIFGVLSVFIAYLPPLYIPFACIFSFVGTLVDSFLGSTLQAKYRCEICKKITERTEHCNQPTILIGGCRRINNDVVNFLSSGIVFTLSFLLLLL